jgi:hypothetical protein
MNTQFVSEMRIGMAAFVSLGMLLLIGCSSVMGGASMGEVRVRMSKESDKRIKSMEELIGAMGVVKMYCWEAFSLRKIVSYRNKEIDLLRLRGSIFGIMQGKDLNTNHLIVYK